MAGLDSITRLLEIKSREKQQKQQAMIQLLGYKLNQYQREKEQLIQEAKSLSNAITQTFQIYHQAKTEYENLTDSASKAFENVRKKEDNVTKNFSSTIGSILDYHGKKLSELRNTVQTQAEKLKQLQESAFEVSSKLENIKSLATKVVNAPDIFDVAKSDAGFGRKPDVIRRRYTLSEKEVDKLLAKHLPKDIDEKTKTAVKNAFMKSLSKINDNLLQRGMQLERFDIEKTTGGGGSKPDVENPLTPLVKILASQLNQQSEVVSKEAKMLDIGIAVPTIDVSQPQQIFSGLELYTKNLGDFIRGSVVESSRLGILPDFFDPNPDVEIEDESGKKKNITSFADLMSIETPDIEDYQKMIEAFMVKEEEVKQLPTGKIIKRVKLKPNMKAINELDWDDIGSSDVDDDAKKMSFVRMLEYYSKLKNIAEQIDLMSRNYLSGE